MNWLLLSMPIKVKKILLFFCVLTTFPSCSYYISSTTLPTSFTQKNDKSISASISSQGIFANLAYSPVNHLYLVGQGTLALQSSNFSGGLGTYFSLHEKFSLEANTQYGIGTFDWGDPFNGMSEPSQINYAGGSLSQLNTLLSSTYHFENGSKLSATLDHRYLDISFDRTNWDLTRREGKLNTAYINLVGAHLTYRNKLRDHLNIILGIGLQGTDDTYNYTYNPVFFRVGLEFW